MRKLTTLLLLIAVPLFIYAQVDRPPFTPAFERVKSHEKRQQLLEKSLVSEVPFKSIGPSVFSGRVADIDVWEEDPSHFFVGYASGGVWKTENNGHSFTPLFDNEMVMTIGDIAVDWERNVIWVGTGEVNSSRSSYAGAGMFKSADGGQTWEHKGLPESHHIGRVVLHPDDPNTLWVAVLGHLYSPNQERGVYKTTDGGKNWKRVLFVDGKTGAIDLVLDPNDPSTLYAATWQRERMAWDFVESGKGSGIYKSTDGGNTWKKMSGEKIGLPTGEGTGRIGLATVDAGGSTTIFAVIDNQNRRPKEEEEEEELLTKDELRTMDRETFLTLDKEAIAEYLEDNGFPKEYDADKVIKMVKEKEIEPVALVEYTENANELLFETPVVGTEVYRSDDGGMTWKKTHEGYLDDVFYSYGYYFGQIRVAPHNPQKLYIFGVPILISEDGGANWKSINGENVHVDHHALWVNPNRDGHLILGNDGGINISYDDGENWVKNNTPPLGQFYHVAVDMEKPYNVYGGLQDNGVWYGPHTYKASNRWHGTGRYPYKSIMGGDGMQTAIDTRDNNIVYTGFQFGFYFRINKETGDRKRITPRHALGERPLRWNWQTPIHLSKHNQDILYIGANKLFRSFNQGDDWDVISVDLTKGGKKGDVPFGTLTAIHESPLKFGLLYTGSDDGLVHVSKDGGNSWKMISGGLPQDMWITRVQASIYEEGRVYVSLNGYRWDDMRSFVYVSENYGANWTRIGKDLPMEPVNVIKEDPVNPDLLYAGTDHGLYISLDRGENFMLMNKDLPAVAVHDVVVHPRENDLIVGTHGRSLYLTYIGHVQQLVDSIRNKTIHAFAVDKVRHRSSWGDKFNTWRSEYSEPEIKLPVFVSKSGNVTMRIMAGDLQLFVLEEDAAKGLNYFTYNGEVNKGMVEKYQAYLNEKKKKDEDEIELEAGDNERYYLEPGKYKILYEKDGEITEQSLEIESRR